MSVFFERFNALCLERGETPNAVAKKLGIPSGSITAWKKGTSPRTDTLYKIADYFHTPSDYLLGTIDNYIPELWQAAVNMQKEAAPALTEKDRRDVAKDVEQIMENLSESGQLMFDGVPMSEAARAAMAAAMRIGLEEARRRNKETYTPKKYRKE